MNSTSSLVLIAATGSVTTLTLNRPEKRNALNVALLESLRAALAAAESDSAQRVLVLGGAGPAFCSGLDLSEANEPDAVARSAGLVSDVLRGLATSRLVTIARVHGAAMAGGAGLMSACDFAIATRNTKFGFPEVRRGLVPALIMTLLRRQLQERDARELLLLGEPFDAARAHAIGLINRIVADEASLDAEVHSFVNSLLQGAPSALAETKRLFRELWPSPLADDLRRANAFHLGARNSAEAEEGIAAFNEKRRPRWAP
jgi:methylglutaconyl-CoA hydratase